MASKSLAIRKYTEPVDFSMPFETQVLALRNAFDAAKELQDLIPIGKQIPTSPAKRYAVTTTLPMIESGDMGKAVEAWQKIIGVKEDGEFGPKTKAATIAFQRAYQLEVDGIAGPESWGAGLRMLE